MVASDDVRIRPAEEAAAAVARSLAAAIEARGAASLACSGGRTPGAVWVALAAMDLPWDRVHVWQVDERVVPEGDPARNLGPIRSGFASVPVRLHPMPLDGSDYDPGVIDVVQLGLGADGHVASLFPGAEWPPRFGYAGVHLGHARYTLGFDAINGARERMFVVTGADKAPALRRVMEGDRALPGAHVRREGTTVFTDQDPT